jgi:hypothetical protein
MEIPGSGSLLRRLVIARGAARFAVHKAIRAEADINDGLAEAAVFFAFAAVLRLFALCTVILGVTGSGAHEANLARHGGSLK